MKTNLPARATLTGSFSLLLVACADLPQPTPIEISMSNVRSADYGTYPEHYEQQIHQYLNDTLLDPDSAKIRIAPPRKVFKIYNPETKIYSPKTPKQLKSEGYYLVCAEVNAKNTFGGYTGWQTHRYRFHKGGLVEDEKNLSVYAPDFGGTDFAACTSRDEIFIDTESVGNVQVNIVP